MPAQSVTSRVFTLGIAGWTWPIEPKSEGGQYSYSLSWQVDLESDL